MEGGEHDHGPRRADSFHFWAGSLGLQEVGRREKDLNRMRSSRKEVRLGRRIGGKERRTSGGGILVASENDETQNQKKKNKESHGGGDMECNLNRKSSSSRLSEAFTGL